MQQLLKNVVITSSKDGEAAGQADEQISALRHTNVKQRNRLPKAIQV